MKTKNLIVILLSILALAACSEEKELPIPTPEKTPSKKLKKMQIQGEVYNERSTIILGYDGDKLSMLKNESGESLFYEYRGNSTIFYETYTSEYGKEPILYQDTEYTLDKEGKIVKCVTTDYVSYPGSTYTEAFEYDKNGYIKKINKDDVGYVTLFNWVDEKLVHIKDNNLDIYITYTTIPDKSGFSLIEADYLFPRWEDHRLLSPFQFFYRLGYYGKKCPYLIESVNWRDSSGDVEAKFFYEFDEDGYVIKLSNSLYPKMISYYFYE